MTSLHVLSLAALVLLQTACLASGASPTVVAHKRFIYVATLSGKDIVNSKGDPSYFGTAYFNMTTGHPPTLLSYPNPSIQMHAAFFTFNWRTSAGRPTWVELRRGSDNTNGDIVMRFPGRWKRGWWRATKFSIVGDTSVLFSTGFNVPTNDALLYLAEYPGHHYLNIVTKKYPLGAIRGQLVKMPGSA